MLIKLQPAQHKLSDNLELPAMPAASQDQAASQPCDKIDAFPTLAR